MDVSLCLKQIGKISPGTLCTWQLIKNNKGMTMDIIEIKQLHLDLQSMQLNYNGINETKAFDYVGYNSGWNSSKYIFQKIWNGNHVCFTIQDKDFDFVYTIRNKFRKLIKKEPVYKTYKWYFYFDFDLKTLKKVQTKIYVLLLLLNNNEIALGFSDIIKYSLDSLSKLYELQSVGKEKIDMDAEIEKVSNLLKKIYKLSQQGNSSSIAKNKLQIDNFLEKHDALIKSYYDLFDKLERA